MYACVSIAHVHPQTRQAVIDAARRLAVITRKQNGNLSYDVLIPEGKEDMVILSERWQSKKDFEAHVAHSQEEGDPVFEFGKTVVAASSGDPELYPCETAEC